VVKRELFAFFNRYKLIADGNEKTLLKNLSADLSDILRLEKGLRGNENRRRELST